VAKTHALASLVSELHSTCQQALAAGTPFEELQLASASTAITAVRDAGSDGLPARLSAARQAIAAVSGAVAEAK
jgi:hypothetical protein